jgi:hypothetical protein
MTAEPVPLLPNQSGMEAMRAAMAGAMMATTAEARERMELARTRSSEVTLLSPMMRATEPAEVVACRPWKKDCTPMRPSRMASEGPAPSRPVEKKSAGMPKMMPARM